MKEVKPKWILVELKRFDQIMLQISMYDPILGEYEIAGTIRVDESDMESRGAWQKAIEAMNQEHSQQTSSRR